MKINRDFAIRIDSLRTAGLGYGSIATQLGLKRDTVEKHYQKVDHVKRLPIKEKVFKGKIQGRKQLQIKQFIQYNPTGTLQDIITGCDLDVSTSTLSKYLKRFGMPCKVAKKQIVISNVNKLKRVEFAKKMVKLTDLELGRIWFSDETIVKSRPNGEIVLYRSPPGSTYYEPSNASGGKSVMFWGVISSQAYGPLVEVKGKNTAESYIETLKTYLLPEIQVAEGPVLFQQDNARIHKTRAVMSFLEKN